MKISEAQINDAIRWLDKEYGSLVDKPKHHVAIIREALVRAKQDLVKKEHISEALEKFNEKYQSELKKANEPEKKGLFKRIFGG
jgi:hypothetical protein